MNLHEDKDVFLELVRSTAQTLGVPEYYVEKDYWVTRALKLLSESEYVDRVIFKGGTSLSKAYKLINRFSEDIDLALLEKDLKGNDRKRVMKGIEAIMSAGLDEQKHHSMVSKSGDRFRRTVFSFESAANTDDIGQVKDVLVLEINGLASPEPWWNKIISSLIKEVLLEAGRNDLIEQYGLSSFATNVLSIKKTLPEKIIIIGTAFSDANADVFQKNIRHIYDVCMILRDSTHRDYLQSDDFQILMRAVLNNERSLARDGGKSVLDGSLSSLDIFSSPNMVWDSISVGLSGNFKDMVFDGDIPEKKEVVGVLESIGVELKKLDC